MTRRIPLSLFGPSLLLLGLFAYGGTGRALQVDVPVFGYRIVNTYPHDSKAFTQGLIYRDGFLFESTGPQGASRLRKVRLETGEVVQEQRLDDRYFGEGLVDWGDRLIQLTYHSEIGFVYDLATFRLLDSFRYEGEGWGLTRNDSRLFMSDGSDALRVLDPVTLIEQGRVPVRVGSNPVYDLNELEYVHGEIYANVWHTDRIARISPESGQVLAWIDLTGILSPVFRINDPEAVLNGIAFDAESERLFVTGKLWPRLFEIEVVAR